MKKFVSIILVLTIMVVFFSGCGKNTWITEYDTNTQTSVIDSSVVAENDNFSLSFNNESLNISLFCKSNQFVWDTMPNDDILKPSEKSTLSIRVQDTQVRTESTLDSSSATRVLAKNKENGIEITYYFDDVEISLPVLYTLRNDSLLVSIDGSKIKQGSKRYQLIAAQPAPMMCRLPVDAEDSYLFVPSGLGGTVSNKTTPDTTRKFTGSGANVASIAIDSSTNSSEATNFRCYGLKIGDNGIFCIAEDTPTAVGVNVIAGDKLKKYSNVFPTFFFTDYDYFYGISVTDGLIKQLSEPYKGVVSVGLYPLATGAADYNAMAQCYRNYLVKKGFVSTNKKLESTAPYSVTYLGGVLTTSSVAGIPTKTLKKMTSFDEALEITKNLAENTGVVPTVRLSGFGTTGINIGKIAGGYKFDSKFGSNKNRLSLEEYCKKNNVDLYTDFNLICYSKSGNGFSYMMDAAKTAILKSAEISGVTVPLRDFDKSSTYRLIKRDNLSDAVNKLAKMADKNDVSGISLNDLGKISYSDYGSGSKYAVAAKMDTDTREFIENLARGGHNVAVSGGTYFSAGISDVVFDAPVLPNGSIVYENEIPFYQLVFHGITPMYSSSINDTTAVDYKIMLAASTGTGLGFSLINNIDNSFMETNADKLYAMLYEDNVDLIKNSVKKYADVYRSVENSKILRYDVLENDITKTTFENGVCIYANHSSKEQNSPVGIIKGYDYIMKDGGKDEN